MSHLYEIVCERCGDATEGYNRGCAVLVEAIENSWWINEAVAAGWDVSEATFKGYNYVARFLSCHQGHGAFLVRSEYRTEPDIRVIPKAPPGHFEAAILKTMHGDAADLIRRLQEAARMIGSLSGKVDGTRIDIPAGQEVHFPGGCTVTSGGDPIMNDEQRAKAFGTLRDEPWRGVITR